MRPLVAVRRATPFDPRFATRDPRFWPIQRAARALGAFSDFPPIDALAAVFEGAPPVRFVPAAPRRRRREALDPGALYDAVITREGQVPTRARCWHDLLNAVVWGTFPRSKRALHARQHAAIGARIAEGARSLPPHRTPELDALALLDEGGVVVFGEDDRPGDGAAPGQVVFGHAIYESLVFGVAPAVVAALRLPRPDPGVDPVGAVDRALAAVIGDRRRLLTPAELRRVRIDGAGPVTSAATGPAASPSTA